MTDAELNEPRNLTCERLIEIAAQCVGRWHAYPSIPGGLRWARNGMTALFELHMRVRKLETVAAAARHLIDRYDSGDFVADDVTAAEEKLKAAVDALGDAA